MEWLARMEKALDYLEDNLQGEPDIREAARVACSSPFHFLRMNAAPAAWGSGCAEWAATCWVSVWNSARTWRSLPT